MNRIASSYHSAALLAFSLILCSTIVSTDFGNNHVDENGLRQGYWVLTGSMTVEKGFTLDSKVEEGNYENDLKTGVWKKYYPSGQLRSEITYSKNKPVGVYSLYYENGVVEEQGNWQRNKNIGSFSRNYKNGNPHQKFVFSDSGKRNGIQLYYHSNGQLALEVNVINGQESGVMKRYNENGDLIEEKSFLKGKCQEDLTKKTVEVKADYVPPPAEIGEGKDVEISTLHPNSDEETNAAHHFKPDGHNILYNRNKQVTQTGIFKKGRLWNGKWNKYNKDGILIRVDVYRQGKFIGHGLMEPE